MSPSSVDRRSRLDLQRRWARVKQSGAHGLRRGAWYLVVNEASKLVVLEVRHDNVPVPRAMIELADAKPEAWSVVQWNQDQLGARRASEANLGLTYAVCGHCAARQIIEPPTAEHMQCEECGVDWRLDWEHPC